MSVNRRGQVRQRMLRRAGLSAGALVLLAVLFLVGGHWVLGVVLGAVAAAAIWVFLQVRTVR
jgi:uncharacterized membrane protein YccC